MLRKIVMEQCRAGFRCANDEEIWQEDRVAGMRPPSQHDVTDCRLALATIAVAIKKG